MTYATDLTYCDGSSADVLANAKCSVPIATLRSAPFNLAWGDSVSAKLSATNVVGTSPESPTGNGAVILTYPDSPLNLANDDSVTNENQIGLTWQEGLANGGSPVIDYRISYAPYG